MGLGDGMPTHYTELKARHREEQSAFPQSLVLRTHRALELVAAR